MNPWRPLLVAIRQLTCLPLGPAPVAAEEAARSSGLFPLVGLALGAILWGAQILLPYRLSEYLVGALLTALLALLSGGRQLHGWATLFDTLGAPPPGQEGAAPPQRNPGLGTRGATALILLILLKVFLLAEAVLRNNPGLVICFPAVARWAVLPLLGHQPESAPGTPPPPRPRRWRRLARASGLTLLILAAFDWRLLPPAAAALALVCGLGWPLSKRWGVPQGYILGAGIEWGELAFLLAALGWSPAGA